jgi:hypothetical protein
VQAADLRLRNFLFVPMPSLQNIHTPEFSSRRYTQVQHHPISLKNKDYITSHVGNLSTYVHQKVLPPRDNTFVQPLNSTVWPFSTKPPSISLPSSPLPYSVGRQQSKTPPPPHLLRPSSSSSTKKEVPQQKLMKMLKSRHIDGGIMENRKKRGKEIQCEDETICRVPQGE